MARVDAPDLQFAGADETPQGVTVRPRLTEEEGAVVALRRASSWRPSDSVPQAVPGDVRGAAGGLWIAECDGYLVGTITVEWYADDRQLADGRTTARISNLVVHQRYRRRGIARALMGGVELTRRRPRLQRDDHRRGRRQQLHPPPLRRRGYVYLKDVHAPWGLIHILSIRLD